MYAALEEGKEVFRGTYEQCLRVVGKCNEYGWYIPEYFDVGIVEVYDDDNEILD